MNRQQIDLETFIKKAKKNKEEKKAALIEIEGFGLVEFTRPRTEVHLEFVNKSEEEENHSGDTVELIMEYLYTHCPLLNDKQVRKELGNGTPSYMFEQIFGLKNVTKTFEKFLEVFDLADEEKVVKKKKKKIKN